MYLFAKLAQVHKDLFVFDLINIFFTDKHSELKKYQANKKERIIIFKNNKHKINLQNCKKKSCQNQYIIYFNTKIVSLV